MKDLTLAPLGRGRRGWQMISSLGLGEVKTPSLTLFHRHSLTLLQQRLQLRKLTFNSDWPLLYYEYFYFVVKSMHMIRATDFFFISRIKCHSEGQPGLAARLAHLLRSFLLLLLLHLHMRHLTTGINMQAALVWGFPANFIRGNISEILSGSFFIMLTSESSQHLSLSITGW